jgi:hypothetical protein
MGQNMTATTFDEYLERLAAANGNLLDLVIGDIPQLAALPRSDRMRLFTRLAKLGVPDVALKELREEMKRAAERTTNSAQRSTVDDTDEATGLPVIQSNHQQIRDITAAALTAIETHETANPAEPLLYVRDATLVRVIAGETRRNADRRPLDDLRKIIAVGQSELGFVLGRVASWRQLNRTKAGDSYTNVAPPKTVLCDLLGAGEWPTLPPLLGLSYCPTFNEDGSFHHKPGYDRCTGVYHADAVPLGDTTPTDDNLARSRAFLDEMLCDFPFVDDASKAHVYALMLLPFVRDLIHGPTPLHAIDAPTAGTGKGLIAEVACYPARGHELPSVPAPADEAEWSKSLTTWLLEGRTHVNLDNINQPLDSGALAGALTQARWGSRALGVNRSIDLPVRQIWIATGNNLTFSEEIARRTAYIRLDANMEKPDQRTEFRHPDLRLWVRENQPALVTACCTLIRKWFADGKPEFTERTKGSYEAWCKVMGGILQANGIEGFLANMDDVRATASTETDTLRNFVAAWAEQFDTKLVPAKDLITIASYCDEPKGRGGWDGLDLLSDICTGPKEAGRRLQMGKYIGRQRGRVLTVAVNEVQRTFKIKAPVHDRSGTSYQLEDLRK